jgi:hypothetical protein
MLAFAAACGAAALALAGCLSVDADVNINSDAKASGTFAFALQKQAATFLGMTDLDAFTSGLSEQDMAKQSSSVFEAGSCKASETTDNFVYTCTFTDADFTKEGELWTITKNGDSIVFHLASDAQSTGDH